MSKVYKYARLYDFCTSDKLETNARNIIRRKGRIPFGLFSYFLLCISLIFFIFETSSVRIIGFISSIIACNFIYQTRMGLISYINYCNVKRVRKKKIRNTLEEFCVYHNRDGNYIKIQEKQMYRIKHHPLDWTSSKILFRDEFKNKYIFKINLSGIHVKVFLAKSCKDKFVDSTDTKTKIHTCMI